MSEESLREKIAAIIVEAYEQQSPGWGADRILALPELEALKKLKTVKGLGHSISTNQRDPV